MDDKNAYGNSVAIKPGFDGRLSFFKIYENYLLDFQNAMRCMNYLQAFISIKGAVYMAMPFIKQHCRDELKALLKRVSQKLENNDNRLRSSAIIQLDKIFEQLHMYAKHLHLPADYDDDDTEEVDLEAFRR